jgi:hypothetical protein
MAAPPHEEGGLNQKYFAGDLTLPHQSETCIYCLEEFPSGGEGDHIVPAILGEFEGDVRFPRVCPHCNAKIGRSEQQMLQSSVTRFFLEMLKPYSKRRCKRGTSRTGALGCPPPVTTLRLEDHEVLAKPSYENPLNVHPIDQIVVEEEEDGSQHMIQLFPKMRMEQFEEKLKTVVRGKIKKAWLHCDEQTYEASKALFDMLPLNGEYVELPTTPTGIHTVPGRVKFVVTDHYFRAIAKMAFHYYLTHSGRGWRGDETCFSPLRNFIINGGNKTKFFPAQTKRFALPFGPLKSGGVVTPMQWSHVLAADETCTRVLGYIQLFVGRGCLPKGCHVILGKTDSRIQVVTPVFGHIYLYNKDPSKSPFAGRVEQASITRYRDWNAFTHAHMLRD